MSRGPIRPQELLSLYEILRGHYGFRNWWPGDTPLEVAVGAVLTQNTSWRNVERAIARLRAAEALTLPALRALSPEALAELIRPAGYYNLKAKRLKSLMEMFARHVCGTFPGGFEAISTEALRAELLATYGIGPETADSILLYALERPVFVIDAYTRRIGARWGLCPPEVEYHALQTLIRAALPEDIRLFNDFHAQFVALGHEVCAPRPRCDRCPLAARCPRLGVD